MKFMLKTALFLLLGLTLFICLGACAWADENWSGTVSITESGTINGDVDVSGPVTLNLQAGTELTVKGKIVGSGSLTITGGGGLVVNAGSNNNGIFLDGDVTINGGTVTVTAGSAYGICSIRGSVTITGGTVTASGSSYGIDSNSGTTISDSMVRATGGGSGIESSGSVTISDSTVTASGYIGIFSQSNITISDSTVTASGYTGIFSQSNITISDSTVTASGSSGSGIEGWGNNITINGGRVTASGSYGICVFTGSVTINGGQVTASGSSFGIPGDGGVTLSWTNENDFIDLAGNPIITVAPTLNSAFLDSNSNKVYTSTNASELPGLQAVHLVPVHVYTVTWKNEDGAVLETDLNVPYGTTPSYDGTTPTKPGDAKYSYTFAGWTPEVSAVTGNATYTAAYSAISNLRTVTWLNWDGRVLQSGAFPLGSLPTYSGPTPTRPDDGAYRYTFTGWAPEPAPITADTSYTAVFSASPVPPQPVTAYTVSFAPNGGGGSMAPVTVPANTVYALPACGFTAPAGKEFDCWYLGTTRFAPGDTIVVNSNAEFTALWKDKQEEGGNSGRIEITGDISFPGGGFGGGDGWYDGGYVTGQRAWKVSLAPMVNGSAALGVMSGESTTTDMNIYPNTSIYVFPNANPGFVLDKIIWSLIDGSASYDITEARNFVMPAMDAVVYVTFRPAG